MNRVDRPEAFTATAGGGSDRRGPFVGTRPFVAEDAAFFFGREREATRLANLIIANTLTVLYGDSGVGKSSLINTKLRLALEEVEPDWIVIPFFEWQVGCKKRLEETVEKAIGRRVEDGLAKTLLTFADNKGSPRPVLLVLDQFEEYFLYHPNGLKSLDAELAKLINRRLSPVRVLFSLRSDGLFLLDRLRLRIPSIFGSMIAIEALDDRAAIDCVLLPLEQYNRTPGVDSVQVPARDDRLVEALIKGADEEQILLRLPGRGRSELEKGDRQRVRIVAPFLQMALDMLWQEDVINQGRAGLQLATLRRLAELEDGTPSAEAVGAIAQRYVDSILRELSDEEKGVCAVILERMVLPSGQKVAVKIVDLSPVLTEAEQDLAGSILTRLSSDRSKRLIKMVAGVRDSEPHYQVVHDAMAIPLLEWIEQWKSEVSAALARQAAEEKARLEREEADRRAQFETEAALARKAQEMVRARRRARVAGLAAFVVGVGLTAWVAKTYVDAKERVDRFISLGERDPRAGFRLPLLFSVAALDEARWPDHKQHALDALKRKLLQAPREAGEFAAVGLDPIRNRIAWIGDSSVVVCNLRDAASCEVPGPGQPSAEANSATYLLPLPADWYHPPQRSRNDRLNRNQNQPPSIGFVDGLNQPVIYRRGFTYRWAGAGWQKDDLGDFLPELSQYSGVIFGEVLGGGIRITINDWPNGQVRAVFLAHRRDVSRQWSALSTDGLIAATWMSGTPSPLVSADGALSGSVYLDRDNSGDAAVLLKVASMTRLETNKGVDNVFELEKINQETAARITEQALFGGTRPGLGFTIGNQFIAIAHRDSSQKREVKVFDLSPAAGARKKSFEIDPNSPRRPPIGNQFSYPPIAVVKLPAQGDSERWRFAWLTRRGAYLLHGVAGGASAGHHEILLAGLDGASRIEFSADGEFLVLQSQNFERRTTSLRVWDLGSKRVEAVNQGDAAKLRQMACRMAIIERDEEDSAQMQQWGLPGDPCQPEHAARAAPRVQ